MLKSASYAGVGAKLLDQGRGQGYCEAMKLQTASLVSQTRRVKIRLDCKMIGRSGVRQG
jgi:hypothetical protein